MTSEHLMRVCVLRQFKVTLASIYFSVDGIGEFFGLEFDAKYSVTTFFLEK